MYLELIARATIVTRNQEFETQRWAREWRALARTANTKPAGRPQNEPGTVRPNASLPEGR